MCHRVCVTSTIGGIKNKFNNMIISIRSLKGFPFQYYLITIVGSASLAGVATAVMQKNINIKKPIKNFVYAGTHNNFDDMTFDKVESNKNNIKESTSVAKR